MADKKRGGTVTFINSRLTTIISIALVLFLLGVLGLLALTGNQLSRYVKENITFSVTLKDDQSADSINNLIHDLKVAPFTRSVEYISKERAAKELQDELGEDPETFLGYNPLQASLEVKFRSEYANEDSLRLIERQVAQYTSVDQLLYRKDLMDVVNNNMQRIGLILLVLAVALMIISFVLINNTLRLLIYSKRFLIHTMTLVGATPGFIRRPFIGYNVVNGLIAGILAVAMLVGALYWIQLQLPGFMEMVDMLMLYILFAAVVVLGILLCVIATAFAVNRYLRMKGDKLYYI